VNIRIEKTVALVVALAKLHNFCIDANDNDISANTARDEWTSEINGAVPLVPVEGHDESSESSLGDVIPEQLLHGGEHFDDIGHAGRRRRQRHYELATNAPLPREQLHSYIAAIGVTRPSSVQLP
jgi:hypothetical protein